MNTERNKAAEFLRERDKLEILKDGTLGYQIAVGAIEDAIAASPVAQPRPDMIAMLVDRDTPPDNRNEVVDWDVAGKPITRADVAKINGSASPVAQDERMPEELKEMIREYRIATTRELKAHMDMIERAYIAARSATPAQDERDAFEAWAKWMALYTITAEGEYSQLETRIAWSAWQARAATPAQNKQDAVDAAKPGSNAVNAASDVLAERRRQVEQEGYDAEHDDAHPGGEIAAYAAFYALPPAAREWPATETGYGDTFAEAIVPHGWPIPQHGDRRRELVKAGALVLAEIERIDRAAMQAQGGQTK